MTTKVFKHVPGEDFSALSEAENYLGNLGYTFGSMERGQPIGVHKDADYISKWTRMTREEQESLDGVLTASPSFRDGDVTLTLRG